MKKIIILVGCMIMLVSAVALAYNPQGITNVEAVKKYGFDDQYVVLEGTLTEKVRYDKYVFQDSTGSIIVEVDDLIWPDRKVALQTPIRISGEVDRDDNGMEIDIKRVDFK